MNLELLRAVQGMKMIAAQTPSEPKRALLAYAGIYACGFSGRGSLEKFYMVGSALIDTAFVTEVCGSVPDRIRVVNWRLTAWDDERLLLEKDNVRAFAPRPRDEVVRLRTGRAVTLEAPAVVSGVSPGFLLRAGAAMWAAAAISRLYVNIRPNGAAWALGTLARRLDREGVAYRMKVLAHPRAYLRRDACVVYVHSAELEHAIEIVRRAMERAPIDFADAVPLFTRRVRAGLGLADEPSDIQASGLSHGQWVSGLFVTAARNAKTVADMVRAVVQLVVESGRDPDQPYLRGKGVPREAADQGTSD